MALVYEEFVDFIAAGTTSKDIVAFRPSEAANSQVADLIQRQKSVGLTADEAAELNYYLQIEHLMRLAKARARKHLAESS